MADNFRPAKMHEVSEEVLDMLDLVAALYPGKAMVQITPFTEATGMGRTAVLDAIHAKLLPAIRRPSVGSGERTSWSIPILTGRLRRDTAA